MGLLYLAHTRIEEEVHWSDVEDDAFKIFVIIFGLIVSLGVAALVYYG
jgi:hypothetical protein